MKTSLVQVTTSDKLILSGLYNPGHKENVALVLVHGLNADFYSYSFFHTIQSVLTQQGIASVAIQTRGTGLHTEFLRANGEKPIRIGATFEKLEDAHLDISAWINFLQDQGYSRIVLAGHSLGTHKVVRYLFEGEHCNRVSHIVLLAPFDKNAWIKHYTQGRWEQYVREAEKMVQDGKGQDMIPPSFDEDPFSYQTYVSWYKKTPLNMIWDFYQKEQYKPEILRDLSIPVQIIVGQQDEFFVVPDLCTVADAEKILKENVKHLAFHSIHGAGHLFLNHEKEVAKLIQNFI